MRYICLVAVLLALPLTAGAQQRRAADRRADQNRSEQRQSDQRQSGDRRGDDRRSDGRRSDARHAPAQLPAHGASLPWWERQPLPWWEQKKTPNYFDLNRIPGYAQGNVARAMLDQQRHQAPVTNHRKSRYYQPSYLYVLPAYPYFPFSTTTTYEATPPPPSVTVHAPPPEPPLPPMGALRLEVEPKESLQIYVDGVYVGTPADLGDELELTPGTRRIELRASGYRALTFSAEIVDGRLITYRGSLERVAVRPAAPAPPSEPAAPVAADAPVAPAGGKVMYMIPGCYLGNVSPKNVTLPAGCDISKLTTISP